ncbi:MAG: HEPN domain-containing protein [Oscillospiraceae bacterium]|nr:HEPN domain-containing protein [Oscillospiraceae bacterium]
MNAEIMEWKRLADMDLVTAKHMFETYRPIPVEIVCFHSQQAAEKMLKCFLVFHETEPPKIHDLRELIEICIEFEDKFNDIYNEATSLTRYAVLPRYPAELDLDESDGERAIKSASKVKDFVNMLL